MKLQTAKTPPELVEYWRRYAECAYCHQYIRHEMHLHNHYLKHHHKSDVYWKLYYFSSHRGWVFQRNYTKFPELQHARKSLQKLGYPTAVVLCRKDF